MPRSMYTEPERKAIRNCFTEISNSYTRVEAEKDNVKAIIDRLAEEFEIDKKLARKLAKIYHKRNLSEEQSFYNDLMEMYAEVVDTK